MTENIDAYAQAQYALGLIVGTTADLTGSQKTCLAAACDQIHRSLETLLEAAETPAEEPEETPRPIWHYAGVGGLYAALPAPGEFVLAWSSEERAAAPLQILRCSFEPPDHVIWRDSRNIVFTGRVDYWMPIPYPPALDIPA